ncbi:MAG: peptide deformylase [Patescibacteria group bacterium]
MAKRLAIITLPHPVLRKKAVLVRPEDITTPTFQEFLEDMTETMFKADGVGLAAVQVAVPKQVTVISTKDGPLALINAVVTRMSKKTERGEEGCLSVPGVWGLVDRSIQINVEALGRDGKPLKFTAKGFFARVIQHETDHLNGILFVDRAVEVHEADNATD